MTLVNNERPAKAPPRSTASGYGGYQQRRYDQPRERVPKNSELNRPISFGNTPSPQKRGAAGYGIVAFAEGTRVMHASFGAGTILSARDMGGDVLYEVAFDGGVTKRLMATFAKLQKI